MVRVCCEIKASKRARLLCCLRAQSTTRAAASSAVCCCSNFEHGRRCDGRPSTGLVPADPDRGGTCPVSRCCGVTIPLACWLGVTRSQKGHCGPCCCAFAIPQLLCVTSAAVPHYVASVKVATLTDATWGGFGTFWRFQNAPVVSEFSGGFSFGGFRTFW